MNFLEALEIIRNDSTKMAVPDNGSVGPYPFGIYFDKEFGWLWSSGNKAGIPTPVLTFGNWEIMEKVGVE